MTSKTDNCVFNLLLPEIGRAVSEAGYNKPSPIQEQSIPPLLEGRDMLGCAQTGTGKTAAFTLPILDYLVKNEQAILSGRPRVLILAPTRELAAQICDSVAKYGKYTDVTQAVIFGGVGQNPQVKIMRRGVDVLVATPGRLLDLMNQRHIELSSIEVFVLDEADRMLDMGFIHDIRKIISKLPKKKQSLFFSATMEPEVVRLAKRLVQDPVHVTITPDKPAVERIAQKVMFVSKQGKDKLIVNLLKCNSLDRVLVFVQMKHAANRVARKLQQAGVTSDAIHGNKSQGARTRALAAFKAGKVRVLVATDIASRGIDVDSISHVINYDLPMEPETYVHRIGRTARAHNDGDAISFCCASQRDALRSIERLLRAPIPVDLEHDLHCEDAMNAIGAAAKPAAKKGRSGGGRGGRDRPGSRGKSGGRGRSQSRSRTRSKR